MNTTLKRIMLGALVSTSLAAVAMPTLAKADDDRGEQQFAHFDGDRDSRGMRGGPHGPGRGGPPGMGHMQGGPGGRHGGPMGGQGFGGPMGGAGGPGMEMVIERFDVNKDGSITREEVTTVTADKVKTFDANGDGALSLDEYKALWTDAMNTAIVRSFQFHDPNGDAKITLEEYAADSDKLFAHLDRDGNGTIAADEFGPPRGGDRPDGPPPGMGPGGPGEGPGGPNDMDDDG